MEQNGTRPRRPPPPRIIQHATTAVQEFKQLYSMAFSEVNAALGFDETANTEQALLSYKRGVELMQQTLALDLSVITSEEALSDIRSKREKMQATLEHSKSRIRELTPINTTTGSSVPSSRQTGLPTYDEATSPTVERSPSDSTLPYNADVLLEMQSAQVFFITSEGYVSTPSYPSPLRICKFTTQSVPGAPEHFLQIGNFTLPLVENLTPSLQASQGAYVFPDVTSTQEGAAVGILLDDSAAQDEIQAFESMIMQLTAMRQPQEAPASYDIQPVPSQSDTQNIRQAPARPAQQPPIVASPSAAEWMNWGLEKGAEKVGGLVSIGGEKLRQRMSPATSDKPIDDKYQKGLDVARQTTNKVVIVSAFVVKSLGDATVALGKKAAPYIKSKASSLMPEKVTKTMTSKDNSGRSKVDDVMEVAGAGVRGFGVVYLGLESAAKALGRSIASQTSATAAHRPALLAAYIPFANLAHRFGDYKGEPVARYELVVIELLFNYNYGNPIGMATENAMYTLGNTLLSAHNVTNLGPKAIAKRAAKDTAKACLHPKSDTGGGHSGVTGGVPQQTHTYPGDIHTLEITEITDEDSSYVKSYPKS